MAITINGTTGIAGVDGSASTPAVQGADTNTGVFFPAADTIAFAEGGAEVARFDSSGNLGLSVTPSAWSTGTALQVKRASFYTYDNSGVEISQNAAVISGAWQRIGADFATKYGQDTGNHYWYTAASSTAGSAITWSERARIDSSGRLLVGTTSAIDSETGLGVVNSTSGNAVVVFRNSRNTSGDVCLNLLVGSNCQNTSSYLLLGGVFGVANVIYIFGNGNIQNTNNSYGAISDVKLKENIVDATPKLADLMQVRVRNYNLKTNPDQKQIGVIAQELENIFPSLIDESPDKDSEGNELGTTTKAVKYSVFVPMLIKAIQELKSELDTVKAQNAAFEARLAALEAK
jgi:hypothetical protein